MKKSVHSLASLAVMAVLMLLGSVQPAFAHPLAQTDGPIIETQPAHPIYGAEAYKSELAQRKAQAQQEQPAESLNQPEWANVPWSEMVYMALDEHEMDWDLFMTRSSDGGTIKLFNTGADELYPRLNRGLNKVVYVGIEGVRYDIYTYDLQTLAKKRLTFTYAEELNPDWSPDGQRIVYESYQDGQAEIYVMNADGSNVTRLTFNEGDVNTDYDGMPAWSPDGSRIAFISKRTGGYRIWLMNPDGSGQVQVNATPYSSYPVWRPNTQEILFSGDENNDGFLELFSIDLASGAETLRLYGGTYRDYKAASFSPAGDLPVVVRTQYVQYNGNYYWTDSVLGTLQNNGFVPAFLNSQLVWSADWQTGDVTAPSAVLDPLAPVSPAPPAVSAQAWDGQSGIYEVRIEERKEPGGAWHVFDNTAEYHGGETYAYRVIALDYGGNPDSFGGVDAVTQIEALPPETTVRQLEPYTKQGSVILDWSAVDVGGSGVKSYQVQVDAGYGWNDPQTIVPPWALNLEGGAQYKFRINAMDQAYNQEVLTANPNGDTFTTSYARAIRGRVYDNLGNPVSAAQVSIEPEPMNDSTSEADGNYAGYLGDPYDAFPLTAAFSKPGYGNLPVTSYGRWKEDVHMDAYLPPVDNPMQNWDFEQGSGDLSGWTASGEISPAAERTVVHSGAASVRLGLAPELSPLADLPADCTSLLASAVSPTGVIHLLCKGYTYLVYQNGAWSAPYHLDIDDGNQLYGFLATADERVHIIYLSNMLSTMWRSAAGVWSPRIDLADGAGYYDGYSAVADEAGGVHVVVNMAMGEQTVLKYLYRAPNADWGTAEVINIQGRASRIAVNQDHLPMILFYRLASEPNIRMYYFIEKLPSGAWSTPLKVCEGMTARVGNFQGLPDGSLMFVWEKQKEYMYDVFIKMRNPQGAWLPDFLTPTHYSKVGASMLVDANNIVHTTLSDYMLLAFDLNTFRWIGDEYRSANESNPYLDNDRHYHSTYTEYQDNLIYITYIHQNRAGAWERQSFQTGLYDSRMLGLDGLGQAHFLISSGWQDPLHHQYLQLYTDQSGSSNLSQSLTLPADPAYLSFMYASASESNPAAPLRVKVTTADGSSQVFSALPDGSADWKHAALDLGAWAGQTVTLSFETEQVAGERRSVFYIDEVSLGAGQADVWAHASGANALPGSQVTAQVTYGNSSLQAAEDATLTLSLPAGLAFISAEPAPDDPTALTWNLGSLAAGASGSLSLQLAVESGGTPYLEPLTGSVTISAANELETANNTASIYVRVGHFVNMPLIRR